MACALRVAGLKPRLPVATRQGRGLAVVRASANGHINPDIKKDVDKVVDIVEVSNIEKQAVYCRCWRSKTFPNCDGTHVKHNKETGDNVGPVIIKKS